MNLILSRIAGWRSRCGWPPEVFASIALAGLCIALSLTTDRFLDWENFRNIGRQVSINAILATGMTFVIIIGGIDLSVGSAMALSMTVSAGTMLSGAPVPVAAGAALLVGALFGVFNGMMIALARLPAIIVTLATMEIPRGLALLSTGGYPQTGLPESFSSLGRGSIAGMQIPTLVMLLVVASGFILLRHHVVGRYFYAIGGNVTAARFSGVPVARYQILAYTLSGLTAAIAGLVLSSRLMSGQPNAGIGYELDAIAAVVLGGASITGGSGSVAGTLIGALTLGVLNNGLNLMDVSPYLQKVLKGAILLAAIPLGISRQNRT